MSRKTRLALDLAYANAVPLLPPPSKEVALVLVGCGGTGSWLAPTLARLAHILNERMETQVYLTFYDPQTIELKNCWRQNFAPVEVGYHKAVTLAHRYSLAWGVDIVARPEAFTQQHHIRSESLMIIVGCVDTTSGRAAIAHAMTEHYRRQRPPDPHNVWWLDCGNHRTSGQVLLGCSETVTAAAFDLPGYCTQLPMPSIQHPELVAKHNRREQLDPMATARMSCAELALLGEQSLTINQQIAASAGSFLEELLLSHNLRRMATYIDGPAGSARSTYITPLAVVTPVPAQRRQRRHQKEHPCPAQPPSRSLSASPAITPLPGAPPAPGSP